MIIMSLAGFSLCFLNTIFTLKPKTYFLNLSGDEFYLYSVNRIYNFYRLEDTAILDQFHAFLNEIRLKTMITRNFIILKLLWVTDVPAWHKMKDPILRSMKEIDWILNFQMLNFIRKTLR